MANKSSVLESQLIKKKIRKDISGLSFDKLSVLYYAGHYNKSSYWKCRCDCGIEKIIRKDCLVSKMSKTCGECPKAHNNKSPYWKGCGELSLNLFNTYKNHSKAKGFEFKITVEYAWDLFVRQSRKCVFTGWELTFNKTCKSQSDRTASLDRIDSDKGYVEGNVQWVHRDINRFKRNIPNQEFIDLCIIIAKNCQK